MGLECSIIVPLRNREHMLAGLHARLSGVMRPLAIPYEIIYVDDGSLDGTSEAIARLNAEDPSVRGVCLSRAFGLQPALWAGIEAATGRSVITLEPDEPVDLIPELLHCWEEGYQVVFTRIRQAQQSRIIRLARHLLNTIQVRLGGTPLLLDVSDFALMDQKVIERLRELPERTGVIRELRNWVGFRQTTIEFDGRLSANESARRVIGRLVRMATSLVFAVSDAPLKIITVAGCVVTGLGLSGLAIATASIGRLTGLGAGLLWLGSGLALLGGIQLVCLGIVGEYMARIYREVRGRPLFVTRERIGFPQLPRLVPNILKLIPTDAATHQEEATLAELRSGLLKSHA